MTLSCANPVTASPRAFEVRRITRSELPEAALLVQSVVRECVGPTLAAEAVEEYCQQFASPEGLTSRFEAGHGIWIAVAEKRIAGVLEIKGAAHVLMLFVAPKFQRRGVARALLSAAFPGFPRAFPIPITVNSVPNSAGAYRRLGFVRTGPEQNVRGIRFIPMRHPPGKLL